VIQNILNAIPNERRAQKLVLLTFLMIVCVCESESALAEIEDLSVLKGWVEWSDSSSQLQRHLNTLAFEFLENRRRAIANLASVEDWKSRQDQVKAILSRIVGPFPARTPLNARTIGTVNEKGFRIEKIVFESTPNFYVTACIFIPDGLQEGRGPAILNLIGHTDIAFRAPSYQQLILNLVKKGFVVLAVDPIGQGERLQYFDSAAKRSVVGGPTTEHSYFGKQCLLSGSSAARYFTWDAIRAIDYLASRPEVDASRIGVTGISGGGTQTSYVAAIDDRVLAAAPACYICGFHRLFESIGPQDAEQNFNGGVASGIDHADFLEVRAPKPTLVVATTRDFFSIQGARETVNEARRAFDALGGKDHLDMVEDDHGHGYTAKNRQAIYAFFQKYLSLPGSSEDEELEPVQREDLTVTTTGQVTTSVGGETVFSINKLEAQKLIDKLRSSRGDLPTHLQRVRNTAEAISGYQLPEQSPRTIFRGRYRRSDYFVEKQVLLSERSLAIPFLLMVPDGAGKHPALIYLHPAGKAVEAKIKGEIEWFVHQGLAVFAPDLSGVGETGSAGDAEAFLGVQTKRTVVGVRAAEIVGAARYLNTRSDIDATHLMALARAGLGIPLLHAAVFDASIRKVALIDTLASYESVVMSRFYNVPATDLVSGALTAYDLTDLAACIAPRPLLMVNLRDQLLTRVNSESIGAQLNIVHSAYSQQARSSALTIRDWEPSQSMEEVFSDWLKQE
jgi:dienelactone hydrolase